MSERNYQVTIKECSRDLTPVEKVKLKDTTLCLKLDELTQQQAEPVEIKVAGFAALTVHNEMSENVDYDVYIVEDEEGKRYSTGSNSFFNSFTDIYTELEGEDYTLLVYRMPSKNRSGKDFITCSVK